MSHLDRVWKVQPPHLWTATVKFLLFLNASRLTEAAEYLESSILGTSENLVQGLRFALALPSLPREQLVAIFQNRLGPAPDRALALVDCTLAARFGCADIAFDHLFAALDGGRPIIGSHVSAIHGSRTTHLNFIFARVEARTFRADMRFARFCARIGLVDYWRTSGHWPDCADEVPYDFKAECESAAVESPAR